MCTQEIIKFTTQHIILSVIWITFLILTLYTTINDWILKKYEISRNKAIYLINKKNAILIDIRNPADYHNQHIIHSINIPIKNIKNKNFFSTTEKFKNNPIIIIHNHNKLSHSIAKHLRTLHFPTVYVLSGGIMGWNNDYLPSCKSNKTINKNNGDNK